MAQLLVRNLKDELVHKLKLRAAEHGRSAEEEHRVILRAALAPTRVPGFKELLMQIPQVGTDKDFERRDDLGRVVEL